MRGGVFCLFFFAYLHYPHIIFLTNHVGAGALDSPLFGRYILYFIAQTLRKRTICGRDEHCSLVSVACINLSQSKEFDTSISGRLHFVVYDTRS